MSDPATQIRPSSMSAEVRAIIDTFYRAFVGEPDLLEGIVTPGWQDIPLAPGQAPGRDGVKPMILALKQAVPDIAIVVHQVMADGDMIGVRAAITGTHTGDWFGVAATGRPFSMALHEFHRIDGGRLTHTWHLEDWFGWLNQVGAWPVTKGNA